MGKLCTGFQCNLFSGLGETTIKLDKQKYLRVRTTNPAEFFKTVYEKAQEEGMFTISLQSVQ